MDLEIRGAPQAERVTSRDTQPHYGQSNVCNGGVYAPSYRTKTASMWQKPTRLFSRSVFENRTNSPPLFQTPDYSHTRARARSESLTLSKSPKPCRSNPRSVAANNPRLPCFDTPHEVLPSPIQKTPAYVTCPNRVVACDAKATSLG